MEALRDGDPRQVGPYTLLGRLGEGGMGVVYLGRAPDGTRVAVKLIHARMDADPGFRRRFAREVSAAKRVARFCTAPVLDADVEGDVAYLVTEHVEGPSLGDVVRSSGPLKGSALDGLAASMAMALRAIHGAGVVHRDLKPSNVLLSQVGPKVIDFGIAQLADAEVSSAIVGTPSYMSPEQVSGATIGPASDIFSWGCTVAFAAGGVPPFGSGSVPTVLLRVINETPDLRGLTGPLRELVVASLAKNPALRPTAQDLLDHLSASDVPGTAASGSVGGTAPTGGGGRPTAPGVDAGTTGPSSRAGDDADSGDHDPPDVPGDGDPGRGPTAGRQRKVVAVAAAVVVAVAGVWAALMWRDQGTAGAGSSPARNDAEASRQAPVPRNPLRAPAEVSFYSPPEPGASRQAALWAKERPADAELMSRLAAVPHAIRLGRPEVRSKVDETIRAAGERGGVPVFLVNRLPGGDCLPVEPAELAAYQEWIKGVAHQIGQAGAVVILEPSSLVKLPGTEKCDKDGSPDQRYRDLRQAVAASSPTPARRSTSTAARTSGRGPTSWRGG
nr:protein kinase [Nonomuraea sp. K271]